MNKCRQDCLQLDSNELDLVVLSCIQSHLSLPDQATQRSSYHDTGVDSQKRSELFVGGVRVCRATFLFVYTLSQSGYERLVQHYKHVGLSSILHGNKGPVHLTPSILTMLPNLPLSESTMHEHMVCLYQEE